MKTKFNEFYLLPDRLPIQGIVLFGIVFLKKKAKYYPEYLLQKLIIHERIHVRQWLEFLIIPFGIWYVAEFFIRFIQYKNWHEAYLNISFEREAYANEKDMGYLSKRRFWAWMKFL